jgi:hypothetical protein
MIKVKLEPIDVELALIQLVKDLLVILKWVRVFLMVIKETIENK